MKKVLLLLLLVPSVRPYAQSLHPLEPAKNHYAKLQQLDARPNAERADMDRISFTPNQYRSSALSYLLMAPAYLNQNQVEALKNAMAFPANSSDQTKAELEFLLEWQNKRTPAQVERSSQVLAPIGYWPHVDVKKDHERYDKNVKDLMFEGREVLGEHCTAANYPATFKLLQGVTKDMRIMEFTVKYHLLRARPYVLEPKLQPLAIMGSPSFASGHTLWAYIQAFVWSELVPEKRPQFLALAYEIGESREIMGIHYPSDEEAAQVLAHDMLTAMWTNPKFQEDLRAAKGEWE
ncbi:phosphatase PAP2 family protein [Allomuricauda sp. SCSIO 65647]|uniref:phosphatase PAP2 family protein n=1 Tax=Allomuricauda sp. SCSIO 65647 TaxID=2908843 RepID=UPI001F478AE7|nr:phosphatase PAP2 family protein [Muricauda sp. SCSIO 65647]UJH67260.1 phosphatase PAP2 family protein [Muricauda sp. SCSIO 65647]